MRLTVLKSAAPALGVLATLLVFMPLGLIATGPTEARAARPHPLFGRTVLGNSAEVFLLSPTVGSVDFVGRVLDYTPGNPALVSQPAINISPGEPDGTVRYSVHDVAMGDFDGDGRDEPVVVRGVYDGVAEARTAWLSWGEAGSMLDWTPTHELGTDQVSIPLNRDHGPADLKLVSGDFDTDGHDELAQVYRGTDGVIRIKLWELNEANEMMLLANATSQTQPADLLESAHFDAACGDVDGDGAHELIVGGTRRVAGSSTHAELFVTVFKYEGGALVPMVTSTSDPTNVSRSSLGNQRNIDNIAISTGRLGSDLRERIVFSWSSVNSRWVTHPCSWCCGIFQEVAWYFDRTRYATLAVLDVTSGGATWSIGGWSTGRATAPEVSDTVYPQPGVWACEGDRTDIGMTIIGPSIGVATGDLTGDGIEEIAWSATTSLIILKMAGGVPTYDATLSRNWKDGDPSHHIVAIVDLDADPTPADSAAARWSPELVSLQWSGNQPWVKVFRPVVVNGSVDGLTMVSQYVETSVTRCQSEYELAVGDLDGDAVRLGEPAYFPSVHATEPRVLLKTPPVHFDVFGGTIYDLAGCYDGSGSYLCDCFQAAYSNESGETFAIRTETHSDWAVTTNVNVEVSAIVVSLQGSFEAWYGENFSRTGDTTFTRVVEQQVTTAGQDRILADQTTYDVWEYPVHGPGVQGPQTLKGRVAVVRPVAVSEPRWFTFGTWPTSSNPLRHEAGNVLSYPRYSQPADDPNIAEMWKADQWDVSSVFGIEGAQQCPFEFSVTWSDVASSGVDSSWSAGFDWNAMLGGEYSYENLNTRRTTVSRGIRLGVSLGAASGAAEAPYTVHPYVYRSRDGLLVLDYTVEPVWGSPGNPNWWDTHYTSAPDLAFSLPKRYNVEKGIPVEDPRTRNRSFDVWVRPDSAAVGDTVTILATVHNFSLASQSGSVSVRFTVGDPDSASSLVIEGLGGEQELWIHGGMTARDTATVWMKWVIPQGVTSHPWIFAEVDRAESVAELHENNNKGYTVMRVSGGNVSAEPSALPTTYRLRPASPNPFRDATALVFDLPSPGHVSLVVYDLLGRRVATLADAPLKAGTHERSWNGRGDSGTLAPAGVYFCRLRCPAFTETRRLLLLR